MDHYPGEVLEENHIPFLETLGLSIDVEGTVSHTIYLKIIDKEHLSVFYRTICSAMLHKGNGFGNVKKTSLCYICH